MPKELKVIYEPHPVAPERKAELRAQGYRIIDAVFAPQGYEQPKPAGSFDHDADGKPGGSLPADERGLDDLRDEAEALGIKADKRWGEARLRDEIAKAKG